MLWLSGSGRPQRCFYCNQVTTFDAAAKRQKRPKNWKCPSCSAMNFLNDDGSIADNIPPEYQKESPIVYRAKDRSKTFNLSSPFCSVCTSNQALLVKTLANYLPEEGDPDMAVYERALPAYKASLEERYPPVCSSCAPKIQDRLQRNNYIAKSTALGNWLKGRESLKSSRAQRSMVMRLFLSFISCTRGLIWITANILFLYWFILGIVSPANQKYGVVQRHRMSGTASEQPFIASQEYMASLFSSMQLLYPISLIGATWQPHALKIIWQDHLRIVGRTKYTTLQCISQILRGIVINVYPYASLPVRLHRRFSIAFTIISLAHFVGSFYILKVLAKSKVNLRDDTGALQDLTSRTDATNDLLPGTRSVLNDLFQDGSLPVIDAESDEDERLPGSIAASDKMDWQASPSANSGKPFASPFVSTAQNTLPRMFPAPVFAQPREQYFSSHPAHKAAFAFDNRSQSNHDQIGLARQKFFAPERPTGLENLFSAAVRLDDEPILVRSLKSIQRTPRLLMLTLTVSSLLLVPLAYFQYCDALVVLGETILLLSTHAGLITDRARFSLLLWPAAWIFAQILQYSRQTAAHFTTVSLYTIAIILHFITQSTAFRHTGQSQRQKKTLYKHSHITNGSKTK